MNIHQLSGAAPVRSLHGSGQGLSHAEAAKRLQKYGADCTEETARKPPAIRLLKRRLRTP